MPRLELSSEARVTAPCSGFGVLGTDGCELGSVSDAPTARQPREGVPGRGMRKERKFFPPSQG